MKAISWLLLMGLAVNVGAAEMTKTNAASEVTNAPAKKTELAAVPDASHQPVLTTNTVTIAGKRVTYQAETGMLPILKPDGTSRASVFYVAYTRMEKSETGKEKSEIENRQSEIAGRPVTFCFNGGPGSSSVWLHLGALGPRRVKLNDDGTLPKPPFGLMDNPYSILDGSDLVFIDPVATGFSRAAKDEKPSDFFSQSADLESVGEFIRLWTTRHVFERAGPPVRRAGFCHH